MIGSSSAPALLGCVVIFATSCAEPRAAPPPMGQIPDMVTTAEPEWLPFAIRAGTRENEDPRETHLTDVRRLTTEADVARVAWSPDARRVALEARIGGDAHSQVYVMDLGTGATTRASQPSVDASSPTFSWPDGARVIFAEETGGKRRIVSASGDGRDTRELARDGSDPAVLADGSALVFVREEGQSRDLFIQGIPNGNAHRLVLDPTREELMPVTSMDRTRVAWIGKKKPASVLMTARVGDENAEARGVEALSSDVESIRSPGFFPDSHRLAFASDRDDARFQIYVVDLDERFGPGAPPRSLRVTFADGGSEAPTVSPDGRHVAFVSRRGHHGGETRQLFIARWVEDP